MPWAKNGTPDTLTGVGDVLEITDLTARKFNLFLMQYFINPGNPQSFFRIDDISTSTYARRREQQGEQAAPSVTHIQVTRNSPFDNQFNVFYSINIAAEEKLFIIEGVSGQSTGAGTAPARSKWVGKQSGTSVAFTSISADNGGTGDYDTDTNLSAIGTD